MVHCASCQWLNADDGNTQALRSKVAELLEVASVAQPRGLSVSDGNSDSSQTGTSVAISTSNSENRGFPGWNATATLLWFGTTFPFSDLYVDKFAELDIDAASLRNLCDAELHDELQVCSSDSS